MLNCPRDNQSLKYIENDSGTFSYCQECGGIWISGKDLLNSVGIDAEDYLHTILQKGIKIDKKAEVKFTCRCEQKMETIKIQDVFIDICPDCKSTRFDFQELGKLKDNIDFENSLTRQALDDLSENYIHSFNYDWKMFKYETIANVIGGFIKAIIK